MTKHSKRKENREKLVKQPPQGDVAVNRLPHAAVTFGNPTEREPSGGQRLGSCPARTAGQQGEGICGNWCFGFPSTAESSNFLSRERRPDRGGGSRNRGVDAAAKTNPPRRRSAEGLPTQNRI